MTGIDVTGIDKAKFAKAVYALSEAGGLGFLHARDGGLSDEDAQELASDEEGLRMDYVHGRACKMNLYVEDGKLIAPTSWYDHTDEQYDDLLSQFGFSREEKPEHGGCCNCEKCAPNSPSRDPEKVFGEMVKDEPALVNAWERKKKNDLEEKISRN